MVLLASVPPALHAALHTLEFLSRWVAPTAGSGCPSLHCPDLHCPEVRCADCPVQHLVPPALTDALTFAQSTCAASSQSCPTRDCSSCPDRFLVGLWAGLALAVVLFGLFVGLLGALWCVLRRRRAVVDSSVVDGPAPEVGALPRALARPRVGSPVTPARLRALRNADP